MKKRNLNADMIKAIAIILVVIGHIIQFVYAPQNFDENHIFRYIYSFHMPLFMFVSGYFSYRVGKENDFQWLSHRFLKLVVPFLVWLLPTYYLLGRYQDEILSDFLLGVIKNPDNGGLWFLWVLFLECCCLSGANYLERGLHKLCSGIIKHPGTSFLLSGFTKLLVMLFVWQVNSRGFHWLGLELCNWQMIFFFGGCIFSQFKKTYSHRFPIQGIQWVWKVVCFILFPILGYFWSRVAIPSFAINWGTIGALLFRLGVPFLGIGFIWNIVPYIKEGIKEKISILGLYTSEIYILQTYFIRGYCGNVIIDCMISLISGLILSYFIAKYMERQPVLGMILFGKGIRRKELNSST